MIKFSRAEYLVYFPALPFYHGNVRTHNMALKICPKAEQEILMLPCRGRICMLNFDVHGGH